MSFELKKKVSSPDIEDPPPVEYKSKAFSSKWNAHSRKQGLDIEMSYKNPNPGGRYDGRFKPGTKKKAA